MSGGCDNTYTYVGYDSLGSIDPYGLYSWDEFLDDSTNFSAGMGDAISFGATDLIRDAMGTNGVVNHCSGMYSSGEAAGIAVQYVIFKGRSVPERAVSEAVAKRADISTGRTEAKNLKEQLAMEKVKSNPSGVTPPRMPKMSDTKNNLLHEDGWVKRTQNVNGVEIHYVENINTKEVIDFKFKD